MLINQIKEATGISRVQDFRCILFFAPVEVAGNIIPGIMVGYYGSTVPVPYFVVT